MFDLIGLFIIVIFAPIVIVNGMKHYEISLGKSLRVLSYILLGFELFRFFYTAQFYERAYMPSDKVTFTFITFFVIAALFASFNKGIFGQVCKSIVVFTFLIPIIMAVFYPHVYTNELDTLALNKALYFAECGIATTMAIMLIKEEIRSIIIKDLLFSLIFVAIYIFANVMRNVFWIPNMSFDLRWFMCMGAIVLSLVFIYIVGLLINKKRKDILA